MPSLNLTCLCIYLVRHERVKVTLRQKQKQPLPAGVCSGNSANYIHYNIYTCWLCAISQEIAEELGVLSSDSSEEEVLTTRVVRRRIIIQVNNHNAAVNLQCFVEWAKCWANGKRFSVPEFILMLFSSGLLTFVCHKNFFLQ